MKLTMTYDARSDERTFTVVVTAADMERFSHDLYIDGATPVTLAALSEMAFRVERNWTPDKGSAASKETPCPIWFDPR